MRKPNLQTVIASPRRIRGQGMTEYIIIVALIALGSIAAVGMFGSGVKSQFQAMAQTLVGDENVDAPEADDEGVETDQGSLSDYAGDGGAGG